ncbi:MAG: qcrC [Acidimicrobiales bacterium]|nr:qcrC [Acidimicrobiales bacterium]
MSDRRPGLRRRDVLAVGLVLATALVITSLVISRRPAAAGADQQARGRELYLTGCVSCHGVKGEGVVGPDGRRRGPSLQTSGEAGAYYYLSTGRMPLGSSDEQPRRKKRAYEGADLDALVAYVASLGTGPKAPIVHLAGADLAKGGELYRANCQACHSASGSGGALSYGRAAPSLHSAQPREIAAAMRAGPGQMPVFSSREIGGRDLDAVVRYVQYLRTPRDPGGLPIGRIGPIPEGFVAWSIGMVALLAIVAWIGTRMPIRREVEVPDQPGEGSP